MHGNLTLRTFGLLCVSITLGSFGQVFLKKGLLIWGLGKYLAHHSTASILRQYAANPNAFDVRPLADPLGLSHTVANLASAIVQPWVMLGLGIYVFSTFFWLVVISRVRLSVAYPLISMSYPVVVVLSGVMLHEEIKVVWAVAGLAFISAGVSFIGVGLGKGVGEVQPCKD